MTVVAVVKPFKIEEVTEALHALGVSGVTLTEIVATAASAGTPRRTVVREYKIDYLPKVRIEIVEDGDADRVGAAIVAGCVYGQDRGWQAMDRPDDNAMRIRTGEVGSEAL